jgi:hypothetical protein
VARADDEVRGPYRRQVRGRGLHDLGPGVVHREEAAVLGAAGSMSPGKLRLIGLFLIMPAIHSWFNWIILGSCYGPTKGLPWKERVPVWLP